MNPFKDHFADDPVVLPKNYKDFDEKDKMILRQKDQIRRMDISIQLAQFAVKELLNFRCFDGVWKFNRSPKDGYAKYDELAPFLSETFLYNSVGKETARSILVRVRWLQKMLDMPEWGPEERSYSEDEEVALRMALDRDNRDYWRKIIRGETPEERKKQIEEHREYLRKKVRESRASRDSTLAMIDEFYNEDFRIHEERQQKKREREQRRIRIELKAKKK